MWGCLSQDPGGAVILAQSCLLPVLELLSFWKPRVNLPGPRALKPGAASCRE